MVGDHPVVENLNVRGAVHRLEDHVLTHLKHVVGVMVEVTRPLPEAGLEQLRAPNLLVSRGIEPLANVLLDQAIEQPAPRVPENRSGSFFLNVEQAKLRADYTVIIVERSDIASSYLMRVK